jgi:hypothetical protein
VLADKFRAIVASNIGRLAPRRATLQDDLRRRFTTQQLTNFELPNGPLLVQTGGTLLVQTGGTLLVISDIFKHLGGRL